MFRTLTQVPDTAFNTAVEPTATDWTTITRENKGTTDSPKWVDKSEVNKAKKDMLTNKYIMMSEQDMDKLDQFNKDQAEVIVVVRGQCDLDITNKLDAIKYYTNAVNAQDLVGVLIVLRYLWVVNNDQGRSFCLMKAITTTANLLNIKKEQNKLATKFQERLKVEYMTAKAVSRKFSIGTAALTTILEDKGEKYAGYCAMSEVDQKERERLADQLTMVILRNKDMKRNLAKDYSTRKLEYPKILADAHAIYTATYHNRLTSRSKRQQQNNNDNKEKDAEEADDDT